MVVSHAANSDTFTVTTPSDREIRITRLFDAPRQLVFDAMTKCEHVKRWWGAAKCDIDLRVGGAWRFGGSGADEMHPVFYGTYQEIAPPDRLVYTEFFEPFPNGSLVTTLLTEENGKTRMTITAEYDSREVRDTVINSGMEKGAAICYDRLEEIVGELQRR